MSQLWLNTGAGCVLKEDTVTKTSNNGNWDTAYGAQQVSTGKHEWKIKIVNSDAAMIGIASDVRADLFTRKTGGYAYYTNTGEKYFGAAHGGMSSDYGVSSRNGDVITVHLDLDIHTLAFSKNDKFLGIAFNDIPQKAYRVAVSIIYTNHAFEMISYVNLSDDQKEAEFEPGHKIQSIPFVEDISSIFTKQLKHLEGTYPIDKIQTLNIKELVETDTYLAKMNEGVDAIKRVLQQYEAKLLETRNRVKQHMNVDVRTYQKWNMKQVEIWLNGLEHGRYKPYIPKLIAGFTNDAISATDLPDLDQGDLRSFGVEQFKDRKDLRNIFQQLKEANEGITTTATPYI